MNRPEPKPMPGPLRVLVLLVAVALVCSLGAVIVHRDGAGSDKATVRSNGSSSTGGKSATAGKDDADRGSWAGLKHAGIPAPGDWSRRLVAFEATAGKDGTVTVGESTVTVNDRYGPIDAALTTVNALLDPDGDDQAWRDRVFSTLGKDGGGNERSLSDAPRWWWSQRRFDKDSTCTGRAADKYVSNAYSCTADGESKESDTGIIRSNAFYPSETNFPVPDGSDIPSTTNPQDVVSRAYDTILIPMDDGNWHVTVYCPATLDQPMIDGQGNETDKTAVRSGGSAYVPASPTAYGTAQRPCHTVEVTVGGQKPFWSLRSTR